MISNRKTLLAGGILASALAAAGPSCAELTPKESVELGQAAIADLGGTLIWQEREDTHDGILLRGVEFAIQVDNNRMVVGAESARFVDAGGGAVSVQLPDTLSIDWSMSPTLEFTGTATYQDLEILLSLDSRLTIEVSAPEVVTEGKFRSTTSNDAVSQLCNYSGVKSVYVAGVEVTGKSSIDVESGADQAICKFSDEAELTVLSLLADQLQMSAELEIPPLQPGEDQVRVGDIRSDLELSAARSSLQVTSMVTNSSLLLESGSWAAGTRMSPGSTISAFVVENVGMAFKLGQLEELRAAIASIGMAVDWSKLPSMAQALASVRFDVTGIELGQQVRRLIDPEKSLSDDPGSIAVDVSIFAPADWWEKGGGGPNVLLPNSGDMTIIVDRLQAMLLGAEFSVNGKVDFENPGAVPGEILPRGTMLVELAGVRELLEFLWARQWIDDQFVLAMQLVLGVGKETDDGGLVYDIDFNGSGGIKINDLSIIE